MKLEEVVKQTIQDFKLDGISFSAHDVTKNIRNKVNNGFLIIDNLDTKNLSEGGQLITTQEVKHEDVKLIVQNLMFSDINYTTNSSGPYKVYQPITTYVVSPANTNPVTSVTVDEVEELLTKREKAYKFKIGRAHV